MNCLSLNTSILALLFIIAIRANEAFAQTDLNSRLIYSAKLTFQSYGLPGKNNFSRFKNIGGAIAVDYVYNQSQNLVQNFTFGMQRHSEHETIYYLNTQFAYRPLLFKALELGMGLGIGYALNVSNPKNRYYEQSGNIWQLSKNQSKTHLQVPISISLGYKTRLHGVKMTPYIGYESAAFIKYNSAFLALPYSLLSIGTRIQK